MAPPVWVRAVRAPFFTASIVPVVIGTALAFYVTGAFNAAYFFLALLGTVMVHAGVNLSNDYFDHKSGNDEANKNPTPFSGGSRVIQEGIIPAGTILNASLLSFAAGSAIGIYLYIILGTPILLLGAAGVLIGFFYTAPPLKLGYRGMGEVFVGIGFGTIVVLGSYYVQTLTMDVRVAAASVPIAILITLVLFINEFPDYEADKKVGKMTAVVRFGKKRSARVYTTLLALCYVWTAAMVAYGIAPITVMLVLLTVPTALKASKILGKNYDKINELLPANASTIMLHITFGLLFATGYVIGGFLNI